MEPAGEMIWPVVGHSGGVGGGGGGDGGGGFRDNSSP